MTTDESGFDSSDFIQSLVINCPQGGAIDRNNVALPVVPSSGPWPSVNSKSHR